MDPTGLDAALQVIVMAAMVIGLLGLAVPIFPGLFVIWLSGLIYGVTTGFDWLGVLIMVLMTVLWIGGSLADNIFMGAKTLQSGGSWWTIGIATVAGVIGTLIVPIIGGLVAALLAAFLFEYARHKDWRKAADLTRGMAVGCGWAFFVRFAIGLLMIGLWVIWAML